MRNLLLFLSLALFAPAAPLLAVDGTWHVLGPDGGPVYDVAFQPGNPQVMYASVWGGVYKSRDGGASWAWSGEGLLQLSQTFNVAFDAVQPETVYVAQGGGVYRSLNGGQTWRYTGRAVAYGVAAHPRFGGKVFAATEYGLYRSSDSGSTWTRVTQGLPASYRVTLIVFDPADERRLYASAQDPDTNEGGLFRSTDGGVTWRPIHGGPLRGRRALSLAIDARSPQTLYAGTEGAGVYKSTNGGATWRSTGLTTAGFIWTLKAHPRLSGVVYAGTGPGLFRSQDGGATWTRVSQGLPAGEGVFAVAFSPSSAQTVYAGVATLFEQGGLFKSANGGRSWTFSSRGISGLSIESLAVDPHHPDTLWVIGNTVLFRSTDRGRTWTRVRPGPGTGDVRVQRVAVDPTDGSNVYVMLPDGSMRRTRDGGQAWEVIGNPNVAPFGNARIVIDPQTPSTIYAAGIGIAKSTNGGTAWSPLPGEPSDMVFFDLGIAPSSPLTLYGTGGGGSAGARVVRSTDGGATWTRIEQGLPTTFSQPLFDLAVDPLVSTTVYGVFDDKVYKTADGGASWSVFSDGDIFPERALGVLGISPFPSGLLYVGVGTGWVDEIAANGSREPLGTSPRRALYTILAVDPNDPCRIYAGTSTWGLMAFTKSGTAECN
jgi:photosystem II stability/assembly factor-like uncharacterized protein